MLHRVTVCVEEVSMLHAVQVSTTVDNAVSLSCLVVIKES